MDLSRCIPGVSQSASTARSRVYSALSASRGPEAATPFNNLISKTNSKRKGLLPTRPVQLRSILWGRGCRSQHPSPRPAPSKMTSSGSMASHSPGSQGDQLCVAPPCVFPLSPLEFPFPFPYSNLSRRGKRSWGKKKKTELAAAKYFWRLHNIFPSSSSHVC